jgi:undecaprenyl phosphate-alpha-L-ara4FN deformylase
MKTIGLRVDADTFYGTRDGLPSLLDLFAKYDIRATFFFCAGPDTMGRHLWRLFHPAFFLKMLRSNAPSLYSLKILFAGTAWPGRRILPALGAALRACAEAGHEVGLHAWNHQSWQANMPRWPERRLEREIRQGLEALESVLGRKVECSAVPGWCADERVLAVKETFGFRYNSDCRGSRPFRPLFADGRVGTVQIPVTLPTFDEIVGSVVSESGYNEYILEAMQQAVDAKEGAPVYTIHTEVEGISRRVLFEDFLRKAAERRFVFSPLGALLPDDLSALPLGRVESLPFSGREGRLGRQIEVT